MKSFQKITKVALAIAAMTLVTSCNDDNKNTPEVKNNNKYHELLY